MWLIVATPMAWRWPANSQPAPQYRTRAGWTTDKALALRINSERNARIEMCCVTLPRDFTATVREATDGS